MSRVVYKVETEREDDGGWIAEVLDLPGVVAHGATEKEAIDTVRVLALKVIAEKNQRPGELA
jgi:predicted RNase H-like HicB family nuclease